MQKFGFVPLAKKSVKGYMQAVSDDGKIIIYRNEQKFFVYFYHEKEVTEAIFHINYFPIMVKEKYSEQAVPLSAINTRLFDSTIQIYLIHYDFKQITMVSIGNYGKDQPKIRKSYFTSHIYDVVMHPSEDCLVVLESSNIHFAFRPNSAPEVTILIDPKNQFNETIWNAQLQIINDSSSIYYYIIYVQDFYLDHEWNIHKYEENNFTKNYTFLQQKYISTSEIIHEYFISIEYNEESKLFCITNELHIENQWRSIISIYFNDKLQQLETDGVSESPFFHSFAREKSEILAGSFYYFYQNTEYIFMFEACLYPYKTTPTQVKFIEDQEVCIKGVFDRVSSWRMGNDTFILTHIDQDLTLRKALTEDLGTVKAVSFSTKMRDVLIVDTLGELEFLQWAELKENNNLTRQPVSESVSLPLLIGMISLGVFFIISVTLLVHTCFRLKNKGKKKTVGTHNSQKKKKGEKKTWNEVA